MKKIKILILGSTGMLGSMFVRYLRQKKKFDILCSYKDSKKIELLKLNENQKLKLDISNINLLKKNIFDFNPDYILNCIGLVKQLCNKKNKKKTKFLNQDLPLILSKIAKHKKLKLVHFSTDCVFSGLSGNYKETDSSDCDDYYGLTKFLGEIKSKNVINIRSSIIGPELKTNYGLFNWFLSKKKISGYKNVFFSGLTTLELVKVVEKYIIRKKIIHYGLFHISSKRISKYDLLNMINKIYKKKIIINKNFSLFLDRSLNSTKFKNKTLYKPKTWKRMIRELKEKYEYI